MAAQGRVEDVKTVLSGLRNAVSQKTRITYEMGAETKGDIDSVAIKRAVTAAEAADMAVLVIGEDFDLSGEARSRSNIALPAPQLALAKAILATDTPVVVVLMNGRPMDLSPLADEADAILETWMLGIETGPAVAQTLFGDVSPAGRLPVSFPRKTGQVPYFMGHANRGRPASPDLSKDTARYMDVAITPQYAFGYGLSYTSFAYDDLQQSAEEVGPHDSLKISFTVRNSGQMASDEVAQLYVRDPVALIARPVMELRGFKRLHLAPGEQARVTFTLHPSQFAYFGPAGRWRADKGEIRFMIGASSDDIRLTGQVGLKASALFDHSGASLETPVAVERVKP